MARIHDVKEVSDSVSAQRPAVANPRRHGLRLALAAAAALALAVGVRYWMSGPKPVTEAEPPIATASPEAATPVASAAPTGASEPAAVAEPDETDGGSVETLESLAQEYDRLVGSRAGVSREYIEKVEAFLAGDGRTDRETEIGWKLLADAYEQAGGRSESLQAFEAYLDHLEPIQGREAAVMAVVIRSRNAFGAQGDMLGGLAYCDMILTRYPESEFADYARFMVGKYYEKIDEPRRAVEEYGKFAAEFPESPWAGEAREAMAEALFNLGEQDRAYSVLEEEAQRDPAKAEVLYHRLGVWQYAAGPTRYPGALAALRRVIDDYPGGRYAESAVEILAKMNDSLIDELSEDLEEEL